MIESLYQLLHHPAVPYIAVGLILFIGWVWSLIWAWRIGHWHGYEDGQRGIIIYDYAQRRKRTHENA